MLKLFFMPLQLLTIGQNTFVLVCLLFQKNNANNTGYIIYLNSTGIPMKWLEWQLDMVQ